MRGEHRGAQLRHRIEARRLDYSASLSPLPTHILERRAARALQDVVDALGGGEARTEIELKMLSVKGHLP